MFISIPDLILKRLSEINRRLRTKSYDYQEVKHVDVLLAFNDYRKKY